MGNSMPQELSSLLRELHSFRGSHRRETDSAILLTVRRFLMRDFTPSRRALILTAGTIGVAGLALSACGKYEEKEGEVTANEDLMREHGIIRRALFVYAEASRRARKDPSSIPLASLLDTAKLFRQFAEDYHEHALEEVHIFPVVRKLNAPVAQLPDVLLTQHKRGREITDYIQRIGTGSNLAASEAERFAATLDAFIAMYGPHAAHEDTVLFPAWKVALGEKSYAEMGEKFEDLEKKMFGHDGFEDALGRITKIEAAFGLSDLAAVTAPLPPAG
jgi:hemerythrin-like domain-containing protein